MKEKLIEFKNISLSFSNQAVLSDFTFSVHEKDKVVLTGPSGSGKSSLLRLLLGFIKPDFGEIMYQGCKLDRFTVWDARKEISYLDQNVSLGTGKVRDYFERLFSLSINNTIDYKKNIFSRFDFFDLEHSIMDKDLSSLSNGERQRVGIVGMLLLERKVFFLDEITASLDKSLKHRCAEYFLGLEDATVLIVSHDEIWQRIAEEKRIRIIRFGNEE